MEFNDWKKYRWFFTSSGKLVVGGKNAEQNDRLVRKLKKMKGNFYVTHTMHPGSPFCSIISNVKDTGLRDIEECAIFTGCFSRAWKEGRKKTEVHIFKLNQLSKNKNMKIGSWNVKGEINKMVVELKLVLAKQEGIYRAVPVKSVQKKQRLLVMIPGYVDKGEITDKIIKVLKDKTVKKEEIAAALPAGGVELIK